MGPIQELPLEAALLLLEKPHLQLETLPLHSPRLSPFRTFVLGPWQELVSTYIWQYLFGELHMLLINNLCYDRQDQQSVLTLLGLMYVSVIFCGINNAQSVLQYISTERTVFYRERFAGMYASWAHSAAQVLTHATLIHQTKTHKNN